MDTDGMASESYAQEQLNHLETQQEESTETRPRNELGRLRQLHKKLHEKRTIDIDVPGYEGELVVRYHGLDWNDVSKIMTRIQSMKPVRKGVTERELFAMIDTMIAACEEIFWRDPETLKLSALDQDAPLRFDVRLYRLFMDGEEPTSAREAVRRLFNNDMALVSHHGELVEFLNGASEGAAEDLVGESQGQR